MAKINDEPAIVLNIQPFREKSLLVSLFTLNHGRIKAVARSLRGRRGGQPLQPFSRFSANWYGRTSLVTLIDIDAGVNPWLEGQRAAAGFYLLELVTRLLHEGEVQPDVFVQLCVTVEELAGMNAVAPTLRQFEYQLLNALGYGLNFTHEARTGAAIQPDGEYELVLHEGFVQSNGTNPGLYTGQTLLTIAAQQFIQPEVVATARRIFRRCLDDLLGPKPLISRQLVVPRT